MPWTTGVTTGADMATDFNALDADFDALLTGFDASVEAAAVAVTTTPVDPADYALVSDVSDGGALKRVLVSEIRDGNGHTYAQLLSMLSLRV